MPGPDMPGLEPLTPGAQVLVAGARVTGRAVVSALASLDVHIWVCDDNTESLKALADNGIHAITPAEADRQVRAGELVLVDVRPADERAIASVGVAHRTFDGGGRDDLEALPKDTRLAFLCHHGGRSGSSELR